MKALEITLRRSLLLAALPAAFSLISCSKSSTTPAPAPEQGSIQAIHVAPYNKVKVDLLVDDKKVGDADYSKATGYQVVNTGNRVVKVKVSSTQADVFPSLAQTVEKNKNYSVFVYNPTASTVGSLVVNDDLTAPATGKANIRLVNMGFDAGSVTLTAVGSSPFFTAVNYGTATGLTSLDAKAYSFEVRQANAAGITLATKSNVTLSAGKVYTVLLRGRNSPAVPADEALTIDVIQLN